MNIWKLNSNLNSLKLFTLNKDTELPKDNNDGVVLINSSDWRINDQIQVTLFHFKRPCE